MFKISKINQLINEITSNNEWINIHMITNDEKGLWLFKSEINTLLKHIGYEELHPKDIDDVDMLSVKVDSDVITVNKDESNDTLIKADAFLKIIDIYLENAESLYNQICTLCIHNESKKDVIDVMKDTYVKYGAANYKLEQLKMTIEHYNGLRNLSKEMILKLYRVSTL